MLKLSGLSPLGLGEPEDDDCDDDDLRALIVVCGVVVVVVVVVVGVGCELWQSAPVVVRVQQSGGCCWFS